MQGLYTEMKFEKPSRIQAVTLPMVLAPPYRSLIAQVGCILFCLDLSRLGQSCMGRWPLSAFAGLMCLESTGDSMKGAVHR